MIVLWRASMCGMDTMLMHGGSAMSSMMWTRMPGQTWRGAAASFLGMWIVMMVAMMTPSLLPTLWRYRSSLRATGETRLGRSTALVAAGYFVVWTVLGAGVFPLGVVLTAIAKREPALLRAVPIVLLLAGFLQHTEWKARHLSVCREAHALSTHPGAPWRYGLCLGLHCIYACAGLTAVVLVLGIMDLRVMMAATAAITAERLAPAGARVARVVGVVVVAAGMYLIAASAYPTTPEHRSTQTLMSASAALARTVP